MAQPFTVREYESGDEYQIVELLNLVFKGWPHLDLSCTPLEYWKWKHHDNPIGKGINPVITIDDKIVCVNHGITRNIMLFGKTLITNQGTDLAVHPDFRRMGLYAKSSEYKTKLYIENGFNISWAVTGNPIVFDSNMEWGRRPSPLNISTLIRVNDVDLHFKVKGSDDLVKRIGTKVLKTSNELSQWLSNTPVNEKKNYDFITIDTFSEDYSAFWECARSAYDMIFDRSAAYMNWRYLDKRAGNFNIIVAVESGKWLGYIIYKIHRHNEHYPEAYIADTLALPGRDDITSELIDEFIRRMDEEGVNATYSWAVEDSPYLNILQKAGYINSKHHPYFIYQNINLTSDWDKLYNIKTEKMWIHFGDSDEI